MSTEIAEPLHVVFTMDCLPPGGPRTVRGPQDEDDARRNMITFAEGLDEVGLQGTFFLCPEALGDMEDTARQLSDGGMELGMLSHPQLSSYQSYLGSYGYDRQREIIQMHKEIWRDRMGREPTCFRAGFFSASDYTYQILCMEGFKEASCSLPGRIDLEQCSVWSKACPFPHHTDPLDRKLRGTMELYEVPVTSDHDAPEHVRAETFTPRHLRIDEPEINDYAESLIGRQLDRMQAEGAAVKALHFVTQNSAGWGGAEDPLSDRLRNLARMLAALAEERAMTLTPAALSTVHRAADEAWGNSLGGGALA